MPRRPQYRSRKQSDPSAETRQEGSQTGGPRSRRVFRQCLACGAEVDPMYGIGEPSWCPHCEESGMNVENIGELPDPQLYGSWLCRQREQASKPTSPSLNDSSPSSGPGIASWLPAPPKFGINMKSRKRHTGIYSCPHCCLEFDLFAEESLKCDECRGQLISGSLDDHYEDDEGPDD